MKIKKTLFYFFLWVLSLVLSIPVTIIGFTVNFIISIKHAELDKLFLTLAIGEDQRGGTYLYLTEDWTISSYTYYLGVIKDKKIIYYFMLFIDFFPKIFGITNNHCEESYFSELNKPMH